MIKYLLLFITIIFFTFAGRSIDPMHKIQGYDNFGAIYDVIEHKANNTIIIASEKGVFTYTGRVLKQITTTANETFHKLEIADQIVYALSFDNKIFQLTGDSLTLTNDLSKHQSFNSFHIDKKKIYASTPNEILIASTNSDSTITTSINDDRYNLGWIKIDGNLYFCTHQSKDIQLFNYNEELIYTIPFSKKIQKTFFTDGVNYLIAQNGIYTFNTKTKSIDMLVQLPEILESVKVYDLKTADRNSIFIAHNNGISIVSLEDQKWTHYFEQTTVHSILKDSYNNLWLGTKFEGLIQVPSLAIFQNTIATLFQEKDRVSEVVKHGNLLIYGTSLGKVIFHNTLTNSSEVIYLENNGEVQSMFTKGDMLYLYCDKLYEINILNKRVLQTITTHSTKSIYVDENIYCATAGDFQNISNQTKTNEGYWHNCIYYDSSSQQFYVGTKSGVSVFQKNDIQIIKQLTPPNKTKIISIHKIRDTIYFFSDIGRVYDETFKLKNQYPIQSVKGITVLDKHSFLIFNKSEVIYAYDDGKKHFSVNFISKLTEKESIINIVPEGDDLFIITDIKVYIIKNYHSFFFTDLNQTIQLNVSLDAAVVNPHKVNLDYDNKGLIFSINSNQDLSFFTNYDIFYRVGNNGKPVQIEPDQDNKYVLNLEFIPEGHTPLKFFLKSNNGAILDFREIDIHVKSPFWKTIWFYILIFASVVIILIIYQSRRVTKMRIENLKTLQQERIKTRLVRSELTAIRSQMNPHFVFNTLSTIQLKIAKKEGDLAFKMVQKFSSLMRGVLNYSQSEVITLKQEINILRHYLDLEQERFEDEIEIVIEIEDTIDLNDYLIPSLITQPIVENSLQHGLRHKEGHKKIAISISKTDEMNYVVEISDNGIGIANANKINKENNQNQSFAMSAMRKRIKYINSLEEINVRLETTSTSKGTTTQIFVKNYD